MHAVLLATTVCHQMPSNLMMTLGLNSSGLLMGALRLVAGWLLGCEVHIVRALGEALSLLERVVLLRHERLQLPVFGVADGVQHVVWFVAAVAMHVVAARIRTHIYAANFHRLPFCLVCWLRCCWLLPESLVLR